MMALQEQIKGCSELASLAPGVVHPFWESGAFKEGKCTHEAKTFIIYGQLIELTSVCGGTEWKHVSPSSETPCSAAPRAAGSSTLSHTRSSATSAPEGSTLHGCGALLGSGKLELDSPCGRKSLVN